MFDNIMIVTDVSPIVLSENSLEEIQLGKIAFTAIKSPKTGLIIKHQALINNLMFTIKDRKLIISNSLHKFIKSNNYSDFSYCNLINAIHTIEELTDIQASKFYFKKLEFALNIETERKPFKYLPLFSDFKGKEFDKMRSRSFWYGNKYPLTEYALKIYDKSEQVKRTDKINISQNILRFEIQYFKSRKIPSIVSLEDLKDKNKISILYKDFISQIERLNTIGEEDFTEISSRDREIYYAGQNQNFWDTENSINHETSKKKKQRYRKIQNTIGKKNLINGFIEKLNAKFNYLINN